MPDSIESRSHAKMARSMAVHAEHFGDVKLARYINEQANEMERLARLATTSSAMDALSISIAKRSKAAGERHQAWRNADMPHAVLVADNTLTPPQRHDPKKSETGEAGAGSDADNRQAIR